MTMSTGQIVVEGGIIYHIIRMLEWEDYTDYELQNAETGEVHSMRVNK